MYLEYVYCAAVDVWMLSVYMININWIPDENLTEHEPITSMPSHAHIFMVIYFCC